MREGGCDCWPVEARGVTQRVEGGSDCWLMGVRERVERGSEH